ncbi:MAG: hypothetical protein JW983_07455 [Elusimicrobia bacterium]|nr:hypothetical protein [Elusimicrobiota bacterium]
MRNLFLIENELQLNKNNKIDRHNSIMVNLDNFTFDSKKIDGELTLIPLSDQTDKELFERKYLDLVASFGKKAESIYWWATVFSGKNPFVSKLFSRLYKLKCFDDTIRKIDSRDVVVVCNDPVLAEQIGYNYKKVFLVHFSASRIRYHIVRTVRVFKGILRLLFIAFEQYRWLLYVRWALKEKINIIKKQSDLVVFRTIGDHRNYVSGVYKDSYFKNLPGFFSSAGKKVLFFVNFFVDLSYDSKDLIAKFKQDNDRLIIPTNFFLKGIDIIKCLFFVYFRRPVVNKHIFLDDSDITHLISAELSWDINTAHYFNSFIYYFCCIRLAESVSVERLIYPFENHPWEKMGILGLRRGNPGIKIIGFQHAFIARNSFNYFPARTEKETMPFPDRIVTMGKRTQEIMKRFGNYPDTIFATGCSLRQDYLFQLKPSPRNTYGDIFVPFTITIEDTVKVLRFLFLAGLGRYPKKVYLRFHPWTPVNVVIDSLGFDMPSNFIISDNPPMHTEMERCGVVLYTWTTVCLEALKMGRPVIYLDVNYPLEVDPLFECNHLKDICRNPGELIGKMEKIRNIDDNMYKTELMKAQEYLNDYFIPVNEQNVRNFIE